MDFMRIKWLYFSISAVIILPGIFSLVAWGLKPAIDFTGGAIVEIKNEKFNDTDRVKNQIIQAYESQGIKLESIQKSGPVNLTLRMKPISSQQSTTVTQQLEKDFGKVEEVKFETIGPILGQELISKTLIAMILATGLILFYITYQFHNKMYGLCATAATIHDSLVILGVFSLLGHFKGIEIDTLFVTALLTSLSFSVHDTVVVFDRIRESLKKFPKAGFTDLVNKAVSETMSRSVNNSLTIIFMLTALWLLGGETIKWFVFALLVGSITGAYSSPFVATPLLIVWNDIKNRRKKFNPV